MAIDSIVATLQPVTAMRHHPYVHTTRLQVLKVSHTLAVWQFMWRWRADVIMYYLIFLLFILSIKIIFQSSDLQSIGTYMIKFGRKFNVCNILTKQKKFGWIHSYMMQYYCQYKCHAWVMFHYGIKQT